MMRVLHSEHSFSDRFMSYILSRNIRLQEDLIDQLFNSIERRLARALFAARSLWKGIPTAKGASQSISADAGGNGWHNAHAGQFLHEQIQETGLHSLPWRTPAPQFPPKCRLARHAAKITHIQG